VVEAVAADAPRSTDPDEPTDVRTHGAGPGGRLAALMLVAALLVLGLLAVYWGITK
jgi:hypothetical protein